jgi:hypothetical protein
MTALGANNSECAAHCKPGERFKAKWECADRKYDSKPFTLHKAGETIQTQFARPLIQKR